jgi:peptide-methionine (S)-S-oxide reductase
MSKLTTILTFTLCLALSAARASTFQAQTMKDTLPDAQLEKATLGGGCFWCVEAIYLDVKGVKSVLSGYSGGTAETANYEAVCSGKTQHAEVVQIAFDPQVITFEEILEIFWATHDPTTRNRQGNDVGPQYRSVIFYHNEAQKAAAKRSMAEVAPQIWDKKIVTELSRFERFYEAEEYHQNYYKTVGMRNPYCTFVITPKVEKFRKAFKDKLKD